MKNRNGLLVILLILACLHGCAGKQKTSAEAEPLPELEETYSDTLQPLNRKTFAFNDGFITQIFTPIDVVYTGFFPGDVRQGFSNFYRNLGFPVRFVNALLQFKFDKMAKETGAFVLNTTFGTAGLFNVSKGVPALQCSPEDFGQTLAFYGVGSGSYLVLPLLGPSTFRETAGLVADSFLHPLTWLQIGTARYAIKAHESGNALSANLPTYNTLKSESFDHYTSMKDVYFQYRTSLENN